MREDRGFCSGLILPKYTSVVRDTVWYMNEVIRKIWGDEMREG